MVDKQIRVRDSSMWHISHTVKIACQRENALLSRNDIKNITNSFYGNICSIFIPNLILNGSKNEKAKFWTLLKQKSFICEDVFNKKAGNSACRFQIEDFFRSHTARSYDTANVTKAIRLRTQYLRYGYRILKFGGGIDHVTSDKHQASKVKG